MSSPSSPASRRPAAGLVFAGLLLLLVVVPALRLLMNVVAVQVVWSVGTWLLWLVIILGGVLVSVGALRLVTRLDELTGVVVPGPVPVDVESARRQAIARAALAAAQDEPRTAAPPAD